MTFVFRLASENVNSNYKNCAINKYNVQKKSKHICTAYQKLSVYGIQPYLFILKGHAVDYLLRLKKKHQNALVASIQQMPYRIPDRIHQ